MTLRSVFMTGEVYSGRVLQGEVTLVVSCREKFVDNMRLITAPDVYGEVCVSTSLIRKRPTLALSS